ncbi:MAG: hypothetical protein A4E45_01203 [Methanosaeta sp. PtaB.Bin039]|nr:MAG: hypothetical protein A4E45_01203 [Methanosaeta sp. PtaB.Bin039]
MKKPLKLEDHGCDIRQPDSGCRSGALLRYSLSIYDWPRLAELTKKAKREHEPREIGALVLADVVGLFFLRDRVQLADVLADDGVLLLELGVGVLGDGDVQAHALGHQLDHI